MVKDFKAEIVEIVSLSPSVRKYILNLGENMEFKAGQFINMSFEVDGEKYMRSYSIASAPNSLDTIELCIKLIENGHLTPKLWEKKVGDFVEIKGPLGLFTLERATKEKLVFIGTGTGISPLLSMIIEELSKQNEILDGDESESIVKTREILLIFGERFENEILYNKEFENLAKNNPNFTFLPVISKPTSDWIGRCGHVQENLDLIDPLNSDIFICGLPEMFDEVKNKLLDLGIDEKNIFHEIFK